MLDVLLVDDVEDVRRLMRMALGSDPRFRVVGEAADGDEGIELARRLSPDLVVLDLLMPGRSGIEALPELRRAVPGARVVVLSGTQAAGVEAEVRALGAVGFLEKGTPTRQLVEGIYELAGALGAVEEALAESRSSLAGEVGSARNARQFVESTLEGWDTSQPLEVVKLLVSELVTNAVVHAESDAEVVVRLTPAVVRVEVIDQSSVLPVLREPGPEDVSGRGLALVAEMSSSWGVRPLQDGKAVWFEVPRQPRPA